MAPAIGEASGESYKAAILSARSPTVVEEEEHCDMAKDKVERVFCVNSVQ